MISLVAVTYSCLCCQRGRELRHLLAGSGKKLSMQLDSKSAAVVFDSADVDSAIEGVVESSFIQRQVHI